jgi:hypothetical protein
MLYSNELKAVIIAENFLENPLNVLRENCMTVQHYEYLSEHQRNSSGTLTGATKPVVMKIVVRVNSPKHAKGFYTRLLSNDHFQFSLLFNATFGPTERLSDYEDGLVADGYVVRVEEDYNSKKIGQGMDEQMTLNVQLLVRSLTYLGREECNNHTNVFIQ